MLDEVPEWYLLTGDEANKRVITGSVIAVTTTKIFALCMLGSYFFKDTMQLFSIQMLIRHLKIFDQHSKFVNFLLGLNYILLLLSAYLAIVAIMGSTNTFDAFGNAVAVMFILEVDDWMYQVVSSHHLIEDDMFEIEYNPNVFVNEKIKYEINTRIFSMDSLKMDRLFYFWIVVLMIFVMLGQLFGFVMWNVFWTAFRAIIFGIIVIITFLWLKCNPQARIQKTNEETIRRATVAWKRTSID